jgi:rubrerythrin
LELGLIDKISQEIIKVKDEKVMLLLDAILADEKRHHELLKRVLEIIVKGETITDEEWFGILWKSVPFHGAPGG